MKLKRVVQVMLWIGIAACKVSAEEVYIAPITIYGNAEGLRGKEISETLCRKINEGFYRTVVEFKSGSSEDDKNINSIMDAKNYAVKMGCNYVIYGYIRNNSTSWYAEMKLFNSEEQRNEKEFFTSDDIESYERFVCTLAKNISEYFANRIGIAELEKERERPAEIRIPVQINYWTPLNEAWIKHVYGIAGVKAGVEFYPPIGFEKVPYQKMDFSIGSNVDYRIGAGNPNIYKAICNEITIDFPIIAHYHMNARNSLYAGISPSYRVLIYSIEQKYEESAVFVQNRFSLGVMGGYEFTLNDRCNIKFDIKPDIELGTSPRVTLETGVGVIFKVWKGNER